MRQLEATAVEPLCDFTAETSRRCTTSVLERLREQAYRTVEAAIAPASRCALLGYPNHTNPGDHAVWLGAKQILQNLGTEVVYECSWRDYSRQALAAAVLAGAQIVFTGGGNFGDLWPATQALRERVLKDFKGTRTVQLQQSVHFRRTDTLARTRDLLQQHGNVTLIVRDRLSFDLAQRLFDIEVLLGPDLAFACPLQAPTDRATADIAWIAREDRESRELNPECTPSGVWRVDWNLRGNELWPLHGEAPLPSSMRELVNRNRSMTKTAAARDTGGRLWRDLAQVREQLTHRRLERGCRLLRRGRVIVTDSLHAHTLGLMLGIPTVVTDNNYGKLRGTFETFTHAAPLARWAETPEDALAVARRWLQASAADCAGPFDR
jgi:exopolysaccharide biosynthesis predicted pyruvyltransferase EpsI